MKGKLRAAIARLRPTYTGKRQHERDDAEDGEAESASAQTVASCVAIRASVRSTVACTSAPPVAVQPVRRSHATWDAAWHVVVCRCYCCRACVPRRLEAQRHATPAEANAGARTM